MKFEVHNCWPTLEKEFDTWKEAADYIQSQVEEKGCVFYRPFVEVDKTQFALTTAGVYTIKEVEA